jgi:predicted glycosyltransferase
MKILVDINHPAHVHFFRNFIELAKKDGHDILVTATDKDLAYKLLELYDIDFLPLGSYGKNIVSKILNIPLIDLKMFLAARKFKPDVFMGIASISAAHVSKMFSKSKSIIFDDTETATAQIAVYKPFADYICIPESWTGKKGKKYIEYAGYHELAYLHPGYMTPDPSVLEEAGLKANEKFFVVRFVSWDAGHDICEHGFNNSGKLALIEMLEKHGRVIISSQDEIPEYFEKYRITIEPTKIHKLMLHASMYIGESPTMATEAALLGVPAVLVNSWAIKAGNMIELEKKYGLMHSFSDQDKALKKVEELISQNDLKEKSKEKQNKLLSDKIDVTDWMLKFIRKISCL